ncbi:MAG: response regulator [Deltaproteobacteria bacterium]
MEPAEQDLLHILVIDDDPDMRDLLTQVLLPGGHQIFSVESAEEGLELLPYTTFQIAFLDQNLPGMEGLVFGEYLRKNNPFLKIALVTGSEETHIDRTASALDIRVIRKPFQVSEILDLVTAFRSEAAERRAQRLAHTDPEYHVPMARHLAELSDVFALPNIPTRIEERIIRTVRDSLASLRTVSRYNERDRAVAYAGLVTMNVLGIKAPKINGRTLLEEYDALMEEHGREPLGSERQEDE